MNTREEVLKEALNCVNGEREKQYGNPEDNFSRIADFWGLYLTTLFEGTGVVIELDPKDVAIMMILFKIARSLGDQDKLDNYVDMIGYAACGAEIFENQDRNDILQKRVEVPPVKFNHKSSDSDVIGRATIDAEGIHYLHNKNKEAINELKKDCDLHNIELADECKDCDYAKKCMGTGICFKEFDSCMDRLQERWKKDKEVRK